MSFYYISACHDCEERITWDKYTEGAARVFHKTFHNGHKTEFSHDLDDDFWEKVYSYKRVEIEG